MNQIGNFKVWGVSVQGVSVQGVGVLGVNVGGVHVRGGSVLSPDNGWITHHYEITFDVIQHDIE